MKKKKVSKKEQEYINKIVMIGQNVALAGKIRTLLDKLSIRCQNDKLKTFIKILEWHLENHRDFEKCPLCEEKDND